MQVVSSTPAPSPDIERIRRFNRAYVTRLGLFSRDYVGHGLSVAELRVMNEIDLDPEMTARQMAQNLDIDEGQISRILKRFVDMGWLSRTRATDDARRKRLEITPKGMAEYKDLYARASLKTQERLSGVDTKQLADNLDQAMILLGEPIADAISYKPLSFGDASWVAQRHSEYYSENHGFSLAFEALVTSIVSEFITNFDSNRELCTIAWSGNRRVGSIFCKKSENPDIAKLRLFFVEPDLRGLGVGRRLLDDCISFAKDRGYRAITLMTHASQKTARAMYEKAGFVCTETHPDESFAPGATEETWELNL